MDEHLRRAGANQLHTLGLQLGNAGLQVIDRQSEHMHAFAMLLQYALKAGILASRSNKFDKGAIRQRKKCLADAGLHVVYPMTHV